MKGDCYTINLDISRISIIEDILIEEENLTLQKRYQFKDSTAWGRICAITHRLRSIVTYFNELKLISKPEDRHAFDFCDFLNNAYVLVKCVNSLARMFKFFLEKKDSLCFFINREGIDETDENYFEYLRSICSAHPDDTVRKKHQDEAFECSPYVTWSDDDKSDLNLMIFSGRKTVSTKIIPIFWHEIINYINHRYSILNDVILKIKEFQKNTLIEMKNTTIENYKNGDYISYLKNLRCESEKRFISYEPETEIKFVIDFFNFKPLNKMNKLLHKKYSEALKLAISFKHNEIQNMTSEGYKNSGLKYGKFCCDSTLLFELTHLHNVGKENGEYTIPFRKILENFHLNGHLTDYETEEYLKIVKPFLEKYVSLEDANDNFSYYSLIKMALYKNNLENNSIINLNIPNQLKYRFVF